MGLSLKLQESKYGLLVENESFYQGQIFDEELCTLDGLKGE